MRSTLLASFALGMIRGLLGLRGHPKPTTPPPPPPPGEPGPRWTTAKEGGKMDSPGRRPRRPPRSPPTPQVIATRLTTAAPPGTSRRAAAGSTSVNHDPEPPARASSAC